MDSARIYLGLNAGFSLLALTWGVLGWLDTAGAGSLLLIAAGLLGLAITATSVLRPDVIPPRPVSTPVLAATGVALVVFFFGLVLRFS